MGFRFRKSIKIAPGIKVNLTKRGVGATVGVKGAHYSAHSSGKKTTSIGIPGTGLSHVSSTTSPRRKDVVKGDGKGESEWYLAGAHLAAYIKLAAAELAEFVVRENEKEEPENSKSLSGDALVGLQLLSFTSALYYFVLDRWAFANLTEKDRSSFSDGVLTELIVGLSELWNRPEDVRPTVTRDLNKDIEKLAPYAQRLVPGPGDSPKGTLYWEFGKLLTTEFDIDPGFAVRVNMKALQVDAELAAKVNSILGKSSVPLL